MTEISGGPAFPFHYMETDPNYPPERIDLPGMSLRDWFAGQALVGIVARCGLRNPTSTAQEAFAAADAMLAARSPQGSAGS